MIFRTPLRRKTRQRSGFKVAGKTPGSECKIKKSFKLDLNKKEFRLTFKRKNIPIKPLFQDEVGILFFGRYLKTKKDLDIKIKLRYRIDSAIEDVERKIHITALKWNKIGLIQDIKIIKPIKVDFVEVLLEFYNKDNLGEINFFGFNLGSIGYNYFLENDVKNIFYEKLNIYIPEISYREFDETFLIKPSEEISFQEGEPIIIKSCNRCSRFLPIDILNERNTLSFSNHCVKKAPCTHQAFSTYKILDSDYKKIPNEISRFMQNGKIKLHNGFQLECKSCKKFFVNAPLNPLRNSTQHREDSLRRRAIEVLTDTLLGREWIYHKFRLKEKKEFDKFIDALDLYKIDFWVEVCEI